MTRRGLLLLIPLGLGADERQEVVDWLGQWVQRLTEENASEFLRALETDLRERLDRGVWALVRNYEVVSSIQVLAVDGGVVELDWYLALRGRAANVATVERRERVKLTLRRVKKGWVVEKLAPEGFLSAMS
ncbi:MAG: hypothetical protein JNL62_12640 [Bryobacterales bacterium]|nr:hypothetical protein [Bryobacterales bacterium]